MEGKIVKQMPPLLWALSFSRQRLWKLFLLIIVGVCKSILSVVFALAMKSVINYAVKGDLTAFYQACTIQALIVSGMILTQFLSKHFREQLMAEMDVDWKKSMFHILLHGRYKVVSSYHTGELLNRLNNDVRILNDGLLNVFPGIASMAVQVIAILIVLFTWEPLLTFLVVAIGFVVLVCTGFLRKMMGSLHKRVSETEGKVSGFIQEALEKLFVVQAMDISDEIERRSKFLLDDRFEVQRKRKNRSLFAGTLISVFANGARFAALVWGAVGIIGGTFTYGDLTALLQLVNQLQSPFVNASGLITKYTAMCAAAERLKELSEIDQEEDAGELDTASVYSDMNELKGESVTFTYDQEPVLFDSAFVIPKGSFTVITGPSGNGKSTLLKLLLGIYEPDIGRVYIRTKDEEIKLGRCTRGLFAYVPQGNLLFSGTLKENLLLTKPDATEEQLQEAIYISAMDLYLDQLPNGLESIMGEGGIGLSEGQAQRLAIARAVLTDAPILLLDEATSALDGETELTVLSRMKELPDRTFIVITHRPAALNMANWRLKVQGKSISCGPIENELTSAGNKDDHACI